MTRVRNDHIWLWTYWDEMKVNKKLSFSGSTVTCEWAFCLYLKIGDPSHSDVHTQSTNKGLWDDF